MATMADKERLDTIRARHAQASTGWELINSTRYGEQLAARFVAERSQSTALVTLTDHCTYHDRDFLLYAHADQGFLLSMLAEAFRIIREMRQAQPKADPKDFAAECAMKCDDAVFKAFLKEEHGFDISDRERVAVQIRGLLRIKSRSELNKVGEAADRWKLLRSSFEAWRIAA